MSDVHSVDEDVDEDDLVYAAAGRYEGTLRPTDKDLEDADPDWVSERLEELTLQGRQGTWGQ